MPKVTILTVVRNRPQLLLETIRCIQMQTYSDWEYIIVDDASDDDTPQIIQSQMELDKRIIGVWRPQQGGPFLAANDGLSLAKGKYIFNIDSDDLSPSNRIEKQLEYMQAYPELRACISPWWSFNNKGFIPGGKAKLPVRPNVIAWILMLRTFASHSSLCVEHEALTEIGNYPALKTAGDYEVVCKLSQRRWLGIIPVVLSYVRRHEGRMSATVGRELGPIVGRKILREHIRSITEIDFPDNFLDALMKIGNREVFLVQDAVRSFETWRDLWCFSKELDETDKKELTEFGDTLLLQFLISNLPHNQ